MLLVPLLACALQSNVHVVDRSGGGDFTNAQAAVEAASAGDVLLFRDGNYGEVSIEGKELTLIADVGHEVQLRLLEIVGLAPGAQAVAIGLEVRKSSDGQLDALELRDNAGTVLVQDSTFEGPNSPCGSTAGFAWNNDAVFLVGSEFRATDNTVCTISPGLFSWNTDLVAFGGLFEGSDGGTYSGFAIDGQNGGSGISSINGSLFLSGAELRGGRGGFGAIDTALGTGACSNGGDGGTALAGLGTTAELRDLSLVPGLGGSAPTGCNAGAPGPFFDLSGGVPAYAPGTHRDTTFAPNPAREGETVSIDFAGEAGDLVIWALSERLGQSPLGTLGGPLLIGAPLYVEVAGLVPASGALTRTIPFSQLPVGFDALVLSGQALHQTSTGEQVISGGRALVLLDNAF